MLESILAILDKVNVPSKDDGTRFVVGDRIDAISSLLSESRYRAVKADGLSYVYARDDFNGSENVVLISSHADALYHRYFCSDIGDDELIGSFDNSICCAAVLHLMLSNSLPPNAIIAFTGDEENELRGASETAEFLEESMKPELVIVLDVTAEGYGAHDFTVENLFYSEDPDGLLRFQDVAEMEQRIRRSFGDSALIIPDAVADESWEYDEWDLNCLSLCLPTRPADKNKDLQDWMHSDDGIVCRKQSLEGYSKALSEMANITF